MTAVPKLTHRKYKEKVVKIKLQDEKCCWEGQNVVSNIDNVIVLYKTRKDGVAL